MPRPDTNPKSVFGMAKPGISGIPPVALLHCGRGMEDGVNKYGLTNWREHSVSAAVYYNAAFRHLASWWDGEQNASDSGVHHLGHVMACCAILLDAEAGGCLIDDRPSIPGTFSAMVKAMTRDTGTGDATVHAMMSKDGPLTAEEGSLLDEMIQASGEYVGPEIDGLCEDEGCPHYGTPHVCLTLSDKFRMEVAAASSPRAPAQKGGPHDPSMDKTHEIKSIVREFVNGAEAEGDHREVRSKYVTAWLDANGFGRVSQMGSIRDQAALYDHIERYVAA